MEQNKEIRINKYLADNGFCTRKEADRLIESGKVFIDNKKAILGQKVKGIEKIEIKNTQKKNYSYYAYNKPRGVVTHSPQNGEKDIISSIKIKGVFPIGRLDKDSEGLIILTNDGRITKRLLQPEYDHDKEYIVKTRNPIKQFQLSVMEGGMRLEGIETKPCKTKLLNENTFSIILTEGKKHQIRRMCDNLSIPIDSLKRVRILNIKLDNLKSNEYKKIEGVDLKKFLDLLNLN
jgi:23S rRNA pseudouridine2604 synthase